MRQNIPKILIVDDRPQNLYTLAQLLQELDVKVIKANSGFEALDLALQHDFCMAIVDVQMPEMDGYELVELLRSNEGTARLPVIFVSAIFSDEFYHRKGYEAGAVDFLSKPFNPDILLSKVRIFLELYHQRAELEEKNRILSQRTAELVTSSQVGQHATSILDLELLLPEVVSLIQAMFNYYYASVWLVAEKKEALILQASRGRDGYLAFASGFELQLDTPTSIIVSTLKNKTYYLSNDVMADPLYLPMKELPETRSELALPLQIGGEVIGILDIQSEYENAFDGDSQMVLQTLADQIAIAIHNARLYNLEKGLRELEAQKATELAELNASKDRFFSIVAHDLRSPFNPLLGLTQLMTRLPDTTPPAEFKKMAESIFFLTRNVYNLLENLLAWSRLQRGRMEYEPEQLDLEQIAASNTKLFAEIAADKGINLESTIAAGMSVHADKNMLNAIIRNLTSNALKFTPRGGLVTIAAQPDAADPAIVEVIVSDTGMGIKPKDQAKLFRLDVSHTTTGTAQEKGTGLGLIICQEMVEQNGGRIWIESDGVPGQGTSVKFTVPTRNHQQ
jgi:signal transduction histidine kinase/DNA-binding response OmpR family regulator